MSSIKKLLIASVIAAMASVTQAADLTKTVNLFNLDNSDKTSISREGIAKNQTFEDIYKFSLSSTSNVFLGFTQNALGNTLNFSIFNSSDSSVGSGSNSDDFDKILSVGSYTLKVWGQANGRGGEYYAASLNVAAVPEPETYAMLLAGLGVMGAVARRRKKQA